MKNTSVLAKYWWLICALTVVVKMGIACIGHNFDMESSLIVGELAAEGKNIYAHTHRYNYGFLWGYVLGALRWIQLHVLQNSSIFILHLLITLLLSWIDIGIAYFLRKLFSFKAGFIFLINPVSILISGFHVQFDNVAVLFGLLGLFFLLKNHIAKSLLGFSLSLVTKHFFLFFHPWLFFNKHISSVKKRWLLSFMPIVIFLLLFIPFLIHPDAQQNILQNVFGYRFGREYALFSKTIDWFWTLVQPQNELDFNSIKAIYAVIIMAIGFLLRSWPLKELLLMYLIVIVAFAPQLSVQYLAIPLVSIVVFWQHWLSKCYLLYVFLFLALDAQTNIGYFAHQWFNDYTFYQLLIKGLSGAIAQLLLIALFILLTIKGLRKTNNPSLSKQAVNT